MSESDRCVLESKGEPQEPRGDLPQTPSAMPAQVDASGERERAAPRSTSPPDAEAVKAGRRRFLQSAMAGAAITTAPLASHRAHAADAPAVPTAVPTVGVPPAPAARTVTLDINGRRYALQLEPRVTLLDALRDYAGLTGTKKGCDRGQCGACTVLVGGRRINACLTLAVMHEGEAITTVEGLEHAAHGEIMQKAFVEYDAFQCGYCTPGQLCSAATVLEEFGRGDASAVTTELRGKPPTLTDAEIRERMSGNLCRCGAYQNIVGAIRACARAAHLDTDPTEQAVVPARIASTARSTEPQS